MSISNILSNVVLASFEKSSRRRALAELSTQSDRSLEDLGISRALLSQGIAAWPWKNEVEINNTVVQSNSSEISSVIKDFQATNIEKFGRGRAA